MSPDALLSVAVHGSTHYAWVAAAKLAEKGHDVVLLLPATASPDAFDPFREHGLPDLLAALKLAVAYKDLLEDDLIAMRAAIAKAEGDA